MAGDNPYEQYQMNQSGDLRNQSMQMRMMMNAERMNSMGGARPRTSSARGGAGWDPMVSGVFNQNQPDFSPFTYNPGLRSQAQAAGVQPLDPSQVNPNAFLPGKGFFGNHPHLSGMIEGGLIGAASARGSDTWGEGLSNVASSIIEGPQIRKNLWARQFAQPFQTGGVLEGLQDRVAMRQERAETTTLRHTQMEYENAKMKELQDAPPPRYEIPVNKNDQGFQVWDPKEHKYNYQQNPDYEAPSKKPNWAGMDDMRPFLQQQGVTDPDNATPAQWSKATADVEAYKRSIARSSAPHPPQQMGVDTATGKYAAIVPGADAGSIKPLSALETGSRTGAERTDKWVQSHMDNPWQAAQLFKNDPRKKEYMKDPEALHKALTDYAAKHDIGGSSAKYVYDPENGLQSTEPAPPSNRPSSSFFNAIPSTLPPGRAGSMLEGMQR